MTQPGDGFCLGVKSRAVAAARLLAREDRLDRHQAIQIRLPCFVDDAHAATAELAEKLIARHVGIAGSAARCGLSHATEGVDSAVTGSLRVSLTEPDGRSGFSRCLRNSSASSGISAQFFHGQCLPLPAERVPSERASR